MRYVTLLIILVSVLFVSTAQAATTYYYFRTSGTDATNCSLLSIDCTIQGSPCKSVECANSILEAIDGNGGVPAGDTVYILFYENERWNDAAGEWASSAPGVVSTTDKLAISASGANATSRLIIGAYNAGGYISTRTATPPILDGDGIRPDSNYEGLIQIVGPQRFWTIENIRSTESADDAIRMTGASSGDTTRYGLIHWMELDNFEDSGISCAKYCDYNTVENIYVHVGSLQCDSNCGKGGLDYGAAIGFHNGSSGNIIQNNLIVDIKGEGLGEYQLYSGSHTPNQWLKNVIINTRSACLHGTDQTSIWKWNTCSNVDAGLAYSEYWYTTIVPDYSSNGTTDCDTPGYGAYFKCYGGDSITQAYILEGNIFKGFNIGISLTDSSCAGSDNITGASVKNNTVIGNTVGIDLDISSSWGSSNEFKYNAITNGDCVACSVVQTGDQSGWVIDYNYWSDDPADIDAGYDSANEWVSLTGAIGISTETDVRWPNALANDPVSGHAPASGSQLIDNGQSTTLIDKNTDITAFPFTITTIVANEIGAVNFPAAPPEGGDTGLYSVIRGSKKVILGGTKKLTLSGE